MSETTLANDVHLWIEQQLEQDTGLAGWQTDGVTATNPKADYRIVFSRDSMLRPLTYTKEQL